MHRRLVLGVAVASILAMTLAAPAAGAAQVERTTTTLVDSCEIHFDEDPVTGEVFFTEFCMDGTLEFMTVTTPSGMFIQSGWVSTTLEVRHNGELLLSTESQTNRFRNVFRDGFEQVSRLHFTSTFLNHLTGETQNCEVEFHIAHGELRWGSQELTCDGDGGGGGEG